MTGSWEISSDNESLGRDPCLNARENVTEHLNLSPNPWRAVHIIKHSPLYPERREMIYEYHEYHGKYLKYYWQTYIEDTYTFFYLINYVY